MIHTTTTIARRTQTAQSLCKLARTTDGSGKNGIQVLRGFNGRVGFLRQLSYCKNGGRLIDPQYRSSRHAAFSLRRLNTLGLRLQHY